MRDETAQALEDDLRDVRLTLARALAQILGCSEQEALCILKDALHSDLSIKRSAEPEEDSHGVNSVVN